MAHTEQQNKEKCSSCTNDSPNLRPLGNRVLLKRLSVQQTLKGGLILPDTAKKKQEQAEVVAIGTGAKDKNGHLIPIHVKVGDIVLIEKYSGQEITLKDQEYVIARADELIAIIEN